ncbi:MAG: hypothetical protein ACOXZ5_07705 [Syntrophomonadaceae bacterium]|jgi:hypothetical protein
MKTSSINLSPAGLNHIVADSLVPGQIIRAKVQRVSQDYVMLKVGNGTIRAETKLIFPAGAHLRLMVESVSERLISLKVLYDSGQIKTEQVLLAEMGLKPQAITEAIIRHLLNFNLPVTYQAVLDLKKVADRYRIAEEKLPVLVWLHSIGIDIATAEDLDEFHGLFRFFQGELPEKEAEYIKQLVHQRGDLFASCVEIEKHSRVWIYVFNRQHSAKKVLSQHPTVVIKFKTLVFGDIWTRMELSNYKLGILMVVEEKWIKALRREAGCLQEALLIAGYSLVEIRVEGKIVSSVFDMLPESAPELSPVNITV